MTLFVFTVHIFVDSLIVLQPH